MYSLAGSNSHYGLGPGGTGPSHVQKTVALVREGRVSCLRAYTHRQAPRPAPDEEVIMRIAVAGFASNCNYGAACGRIPWERGRSARSCKDLRDSSGRDARAPRCRPRHNYNCCGFA